MLDTTKQALKFLDTVMYSDNEDMRRGAYNRVSIYIKQADKYLKADTEALEGESLLRPTEQGEATSNTRAMCRNSVLS